MKRYFKIDMQQGKFMYGDDEESVDTSPSFQTAFGNITDVRKNTVTMGYGTATKRYRVNQPNLDPKKIDLGPDSNNKYTIEVSIGDKVITLYSDYINIVDEFAKRLKQIIGIKETMLEKQKEEDERLEKHMQMKK